VTSHFSLLITKSSFNYSILSKTFDKKVKRSMSLNRHTDISGQRPLKKRYLSKNEFLNIPKSLKLPWVSEKSKNFSPCSTELKFYLNVLHLPGSSIRLIKNFGLHLDIIWMCQKTSRRAKVECLVDVHKTISRCLMTGKDCQMLRLDLKSQRSKRSLS